MNLKMKVEKEVVAAKIRCVLAVRYEEEDIPNDFPLRKGDTWQGDIDIATGRIAGWPAGKTGKMDMKVCDEGSYYLIDADGRIIASKEQDYVPSCIPGEYGDYVEFDIDANGVVARWGKFCTAECVTEAFGLLGDE